MSEADASFVLLTFHGTLLGYDRRRRHLRHRPLAEGGPDFLPLRLAPAAGGMTLLLSQSAAADAEGLQAALADTVLGAGLYPRSLHLRQRALYFTAERDGAISASAPQCTGWESLLPVAAEDLALLRDIMASSWTLEGGPAAAVAADEIRLAGNFTLRFGAFNADLLEHKPRAEGDRIILTPRGGGEPITAVRPRRAPPPPAPLPAPPPPVTPPAAGPPKIWIDPQGNTANRALQYLTAEALRAELPKAVIENLHLPEWGMVAPTPAPPPARAARTGTDRYRIDLPGLADCLRRRVVDAVILDGFTYNLNQYPPRAVARRLLGPTIGGADAVGFGAHELVCSIRGGEVLRGIHPDYLPLPPGYYRKLVAQSGLEPVFFGQIDDNAYIRSLRRAFPAARFIAGRDPGHDFDTLRRSVHVALAISTFSWLAAWLGTPESVYLPVGGMFNPVQHPDQDYLPHDDPAYRFILLPYAKMMDSEAEPIRFARQQALLADQARFATAAEIAELCRRAEALGKGRIEVGGFDPKFYAARYSDFADAGHSALGHYLKTGADAGRSGFAFDADFYVDQYPDAAMEIAAGLYAGPRRHYLAVGRRKGYAPTASTM